MARSLGRRAVRLGLLTASRGGGMLGMRCLAILGFLLIQPGVATAQLTEDASEVPRLPWGAPDLQGVWDYRTATPLQRQRDLAAKERITGEEAAAYERQFAKAFGGGDLRSRPGTTEADVEIWFDVGLRLSSGRTSLIIDPPKGRLPEASMPEADVSMPTPGLPPAMIVAERGGFIPEGVEYDTANGRIPTGSLSEGSIFHIRNDGQVTTVVSDPDLVSSVGIEV